MADSKTSLGSVPEFPLSPNWASAPDATLRMARRVIAYPGTTQLMEEITADVPIVLQLGFTPLTVEDRYDLLDFFCTTCKGRHTKFWIEWPRTQFTLNRDHVTAEATLDCYVNNAELQIQDYERIRIEMNNGDVVVRKILDAQGDGEINLTIDTAIDRDIGQNDYVSITRLLLCRFDTDTFDWSAVTDYRGNVALSFTELVNEYADV